MPCGAEVGLVVEDAAEVVAVGEDLVLVGQVGAAGVDQVDARQPVLRGDLLRAQVLLDGQRVVGAALDGGVVAHDQALDARHAADARDHAGARRGVLAALFGIHAERGQRRDLEEGRARVEQALDAVARQQLAARQVLLARVVAAAQRDLLELGVQVVHQQAHRRGVGLEVFRAGVQLGRESGHGSLWLVSLGRVARRRRAWPDTLADDYRLTFT